MSKTILNLEKLRYVKIRDKSLYKWDKLSIKPVKWYRKQILYNIYNVYKSKDYTKEEFDIWLNKRNLLFIDNRLYNKPYVGLYYSETDWNKFEFNTYEEALKFGEDKARLGIKVSYEY